MGSTWGGSSRTWLSAASRTPDKVTTDRTRLERSFDPDILAELTGDVSIGGAHLAAQAIDQIDEFQVLVNPILVGGGTSFIPAGAHVKLELLEERRFDNGVVFMRYWRA